MLWIGSQESFRKFFVRCFDEHAAKTKKGTKEFAVDDFVSIHNSNEASARTGLFFNPASVTEENRLKANCATFYRYVKKEELFDMLPYALASMADEQKLAFASQYMRPAGIAVRLIDNEAHEEFNYEAAADASAAACDFVKAVSAAAVNPTPENLEIAERAADQANQKFKRTRALLAAARSAGKGVKAVLGRFVPRKEKVTP